MRKQSLRQAANYYILYNRRGCFRARKHRNYVIRKLIDDLYIVGCVPPSWWALTAEHLQRLVTHWQKNKIQPATIMKYLAVTRAFLHSIEYQKEIPDNKSLGVIRKVPLKKSKGVSPEIWQQSTDPIARVLLGFQIHFGLTVSEAMRLLQGIHIQGDSLWVTREIAFNSVDRVIPVRNEAQRIILEEFNHLTQVNQSLILSLGYEVVCFKLRKALRILKLPALKAWRYLYAQQLYSELSPSLSHNELSLLIMNEMGLKSRTTLWRYLRS